MQMRVQRVLQVQADVFSCILCVCMCDMKKGPTTLNLSCIVIHGLGAGQATAL